MADLDTLDALRVVLERTQADALDTIAILRAERDDLERQSAMLIDIVEAAIGSDHRTTLIEDVRALVRDRDLALTERDEARAQFATAQQHLARLQADPRLALTADDAREMLGLAARGTHVLQARVRAIFDAMVGEELEP